MFLSIYLGEKKLIDGVVISGGELTLQTGIFEFIVRVRSLELKVKLDTNSSNPEILRKLIKYLDYIAIDVKATFGENYKLVCGCNVKFEKILISIDLVANSNISVWVEDYNNKWKNCKARR